MKCSTIPIYSSRRKRSKRNKDIKEKLFQYDLNNAEIFSQQISQIEDRKIVLEIKKALESARNIYNLIRCTVTLNCWKN